MDKLAVSGLFIYPIKSLGGIELKESVVDDRGLAYDRRWMLVDEHNVFISQRTNSQLALFQPELTNGSLKVTHKKYPDQSVAIPFGTGKTRIEVNVWGDICEAETADQEINEWFSDRLQMSCKLVYMPDDSHRKVDGQYAKNGELTAFSDGYPILMLSEASLADLNSRLAFPVPMNRFRPNVIFNGAYPYQEDDMKEFSINGQHFLGVKPCGRCVVTTINQNDGTVSEEPLRTLSGYRKNNNKVNFGQNVLVTAPGKIKVGDEIIPAT
jgi:uncharacterized protein YcbX